MPDPVHGRRGLAHRQHVDDDARAGAGGAGPDGDRPSVLLVLDSWSSGGRAGSWASVAQSQFVTTLRGFSGKTSVHDFHVRHDASCRRRGVRRCRHANVGLDDAFGLQLAAIHLAHRHAAQEARGVSAERRHPGLEPPGPHADRGLRGRERPPDTDAVRDDPVRVDRINSSRWRPGSTPTPSSFAQRRRTSMRPRPILRTYGRRPRC